LVFVHSIYLESSAILQKIADFERQFVRLMRIFAVRGCRSAAILTAPVPAGSRRYAPAGATDGNVGVGEEYFARARKGKAARLESEPCATSLL